MSSNPTNVALYGHRTQIFLKDDRTTTSGSVPFFVDRLQNFEPSFSFATTPLYELGHKGKIGVVQAPPEFRITMSQNMTDLMPVEWLIAGKDIAPAGQQQYNLGDILGTASYLRAYALLLNTDDTRFGEQEFMGLTLAEINYRFVINGQNTVDYTYIGTSGSFRTSGFVNSAKTSAFTTGIGGIQGKDASIYFSTGSSPTTDRAYRLQSYGIRVAFPTQYVKELGRRANVGTLSDVPDITVDFDVLIGDYQPTDAFFVGTTVYDYLNTDAVFDAYVRVFDPTITEYGSVVRLFKVENVQATNHTPLRSQVRGLSTARYTLTSTKETTANSSGLIVSNRNSIV